MSLPIAMEIDTNESIADYLNIDDLNKRNKYIEELEIYKRNFLTFKPFKQNIERRNKEIETNNCKLENEIKELQQLVVKTIKENDDKIKGLQKAFKGKDDEIKRLHLLNEKTLKEKDYEIKKLRDDIESLDDGWQKALKEIK